MNNEKENIHENMTIILNVGDYVYTLFPGALLKSGVFLRLLLPFPAM
jgi:hypothetical protein